MKVEDTKDFDQRAEHLIRLLAQDQADSIF
jgi:hypothetical protein